MKKHKTILLPLGRQFSIILVLFIVCTAGITLYNTQDYVRVQTDFLSSSLDSYSSQLAKNTQEAYDSYENICYSVAYSSVVQDFLSSKNRQSSYEAYQELRTQLENTFLLNPYISDIAVYGQDGTFVSYLTSLRIEHAAWLLAHSDQTVFAIATQVGYSDYFYFAKVFKKVKGCTPTAYRKDSEEHV